MPKIAQEMTPLAVRRLGVGVHAVGGVPGLCLQVTESGARSWILRVRHDGRRRNFGLGSFPAVGLADAREAARGMLADLRGGKDPAQERQRRRGLTLAQAVPVFLEARGVDLGGDRHRKTWRRSLELHILPRLGERQVAQIALQDAHAALAPIWRAQPDTARRVRQRLESLLDWCAAGGHREGANPARWRGGLAELLPARAHSVRPMPRIALAELPRWWRSLGDGPMDDALRLIALTACRAGEALGAERSEFDLSAATWCIPAHRTKTRRPHRVPLSGPAVELVARLPEAGLIFRADGAAITATRLAKRMERAHRRDLASGGGGFSDPDTGARAVVHGLRASFSTWCAESGVPFDVAELSLAHAVGSKVSRAYQRGDLLERRRPVMERWAAVLRGEAGQVVQLRG